MDMQPAPIIVSFKACVSKKIFNRLLAEYKGVPGSLVIGGYDRSRFKSTPYNFAFSRTGERFLGVGIQSISTNFSLITQGGYTLAKTGHFSAIDSTVSHLWLPGDVCDHFKNAFSLTYDEEKNYYLISDTVREKLLAQNTTFTFKLGNGIRISNDSINIELPYAAFDQSIGAPVYPNTTRYFPIRRASNDTQYTIGRAFLQEAYLTVDYERRNFSLAQANFLTDPSQSQDIRTIFSTDYVAPTPPSALSSGAKAGIAIGALAGLLILFGALYLCWYRPRRTEQVRRQREASVVSAAPPYTENAIPPNYAEGKPYNPFYATGGPEQPPSEMLASTGHQGPRPELEGAGVGGGSYELPASTGAAREGRLHEMDAGNGDAAGGKGDGEEGTERERRASAAVAPTER
ncbi:putative peptidase aspartic protein [Neofusicoccum parvum UCRNP2]|uniref:Putative peptidase aspartic protein n=1 Tax=Botryosphaeria parva (strain UCR-NP2) TaxID=1287680 RepID=R1FXT1_BOTPV|nr:putative peptidase aspartic protein [Neofusicoccum parvum UCRNP2]